MERAVLEGLTRSRELLDASGSATEAERLRADLKKFYPSRFGREVRAHERDDECELHLLARDDTTDPARMRALLNDILLHGRSQTACVALRDEFSGEVEQYQQPGLQSAEVEILRRLPERVSSASIVVHPRIVAEDLLEGRKWILCCEAARPMDALAVGVVTTSTETSIVFTRAVLFDTRLDPQKTEQWFLQVLRLLGQPFDSQKRAVIRDGVRRIMEQITAGHGTVRVQEL